MIFVSLGLLSLSIIIGIGLVGRINRKDVWLVAAVRAGFYSPTFVGTHLVFAPTILAIPLWLVSGINVMTAIQFLLPALAVFTASVLWSFWQVRKSAHALSSREHR